MREAWKITLIIILILGILFSASSINQWKSKNYTIASGKPGGGYEAFSHGLVQLCKEKDVIPLSCLESAGSIDNLNKVVSKKADFGLFQLSTPLDEDASIIATIYEDYVHILVRADSEITSLLDLDGKRLFYGLDDSGTKVVAEQLLNHYQVKDVKRIDSTPSNSIELLRDGELDAVILVTAMHAPQVVNAIKTCEVKHLSLGDPNKTHNPTDGISQAHTALNPAIIPIHTYGRAHKNNTALPISPICTLSVPSVLICHRYYLRENPSFLVVYAEVIALILSVIIALLGAFSALSKWISVRNKNRIDTYYVKVGESIKKLHDHKVDDLDAEEEKLYTLRQQAFSELVDERLSPDESFRIFQDLLEQAFDECHRQQKASTHSLKKS